MLTAAVKRGSPGELAADSVDALLTSPPFRDGLTALLQETLRALKPGAHGLVRSLPRTSMFVGLALINAGFEVRDTVAHLHGSDHEMWWLVRKPLAQQTVAKQVQATGTGAINIDACRIATQETITTVTGRGFSTGKFYGVAGKGSGTLVGETWESNAAGRWPANVVLSHSSDCGDEGCVEGCAVVALNAQSGHQVSGTAYEPSLKEMSRSVYGRTHALGRIFGYGDEGGASRFFFVAGSPMLLLRYFVRLITPRGGTVLDLFAESRAVEVAAVQEGYSYIGFVV